MIVRSPDSNVSTFYRTRSQLAEALFQIKGKPFRLEKRYPMFRAIYDGGFPKTLLKTCRQIGKSTALSVFAVSESIATPHFSTLFLAPSAEQTQKFSTQRVGKLIQYSPYVYKYYVADKASERVLLRTFSNGSEINFSYVLDDPDRARGISADRTCFDEMQDMLIDEIAPVINEVLRESQYPPGYQMYCGTPKTMENGIENYWQRSTRTEWIVKCTTCNSWNAAVSEKSFGPKGPICLKCGSLLNPRGGQWLDFDPKSDLKGFHISRAIMPGNVPICWAEGTKERRDAELSWKSIWDSLAGPNPHPISVFRNEVIGVSDAQGRRLVTLDDLRAMCTGPGLEMKPNHLTNMKGVLRVCAGIDWSGGGTGEKSRTVLTLWGLLPGHRLRLLWYKYYPGHGPVDEAKDIINTLAMYSSFTFVGGDAGEGNVYIDMLRKKFGHTKVLKFRYVESDYYAKYGEEAKAWMINRTRAIDSAMMAMLRGEFEFPKDETGEIMKVPFAEIMAEHEELTGHEGGIRKKVWRHSLPDDFLHALVFGRTAMQLAIGELNLTA